MANDRRNDALFSCAAVPFRPPERDGQRHTSETDANSLFDAAYKAQQQWVLDPWFSSDALI
jgi:hypothetical protein